MPSNRVVEHLDVVEHVGAGGGPSWVDAALDPLLLQHAEEALGHCIVVAVPATAHARHHPVCLQERLPVAAGELGGFNQWLQHLNQGGVQWDDPKDGWWDGQGDHRCARPAALKSTNGRSNSPSGDASRRACRVKTPHGCVEFHNP